MTRNPVTVGPNDSIRKALLLMRQGHVRRLPVVEGKRVVGILTDRDIWERSPSGSLDGGHHDAAQDLSDHLKVMGIMSLRPLSVAPTTALLEAARELRAHHLGALLVVEDGVLVGILTKGDIIDALAGTALPNVVSARGS
jgi:acetoin utilization protein AcuB